MNNNPTTDKPVGRCVRVAAARAGNRDLADAHLGEAQETAQRLGADRDDYRLCFGSTNVNI